MKFFRLKIQMYKRRLRDTKKKVKESYQVFRKKMRAKFISLIIKIERKLGLKQRCSFCEENIFCEQYWNMNGSGKIFHVKRCYSRLSDR